MVGLEQLQPRPDLVDVHHYFSWGGADGTGIP
eukprot:COSAG02_NODE_26518_length_631_cov_0.872180_1_plen_31_part_10